MSDLARRTPVYRPIEDYGIIGNMASVALVRLDGSIDWCCLPWMDSPSVYAALLDAEKGGHFMVRPVRFEESSQRYIEATNVLVTEFVAPRGRLEVIDFMPTGPSVDRGEEPPEHAELYRIIRCTHGTVDVDVAWAPRLDYGRCATAIEPTSDGFVALGEGCKFGLAGLGDGEVVDAASGSAVAARFSLRQGEERVLLNRWDEADFENGPRRAYRKLEETTAAWSEWMSNAESGLARRWAGRWEPEIRRSELFLKLMTHRPSGALAAAATTSLPETIGGVRNWDYRFTWIRDAAQIAQAFFALGHEQEADDFILWAEHMACREEGYAEEGLQILYPLRSDVNTAEQILDHLEGYRRSKPVRIGNGAVDQLQIDVFGELLNAVYERVRLSEQFDVDIGPFLTHLMEEAAEVWHHPDFSIWEMQNGPFHIVYSKVMSWVALHRACWLSERGYIEGDIGQWHGVMDEVRAQVLEHGYDEQLGSFVQRFGDYRGGLDAANLLIPLMEFLPVDDRRVQGTIDRTLEQLVVDDLVYRYRGPDGLPGEEGTFVLCTCWLIDALALSDRLDEANRIYEKLMGRTNHLGLLSEQIDPYSGDFLGNFPQAYSHVGLINSTLYLATCEGREVPVPSMLGVQS